MALLVRSEPFGRRQAKLEAMSKTFPSPSWSCASLGEPQYGLVREGAQGEPHAGVREHAQLGAQIASTGVTFERGWLVSRRCATHRGRDPGPGQLETVVDRPAESLVGVARTMQRGEEKIAGPVSGEHPTGPVPSVRGRCEANDYELRVWVTESRQGALPVGFGSV